MALTGVKRRRSPRLARRQSRIESTLSLASRSDHGTPQIHTYIYMYVCIHMYIYILIHIHIYICVYVYYMYICMHVCCTAHLSSKFPLLLEFTLRAVRPAILGCSVRKPPWHVVVVGWCLPQHTFIIVLTVLDSRRRRNYTEQCQSN